MCHLSALNRGLQCAGSWIPYTPQGRLAEEPITPLCLASCSSWDPDTVKNKTGCLTNSYKDHFRQVLYQNSSCTFTLGFPTPEKWHLIKTSEKQPLIDNSSRYFHWSYKYPVFLNTEKLLTLPVFWWKLIPLFFFSAWKCIFFYQALICHLSAPLNIFVVALHRQGKQLPNNSKPFIH